MQSVKNGFAPPFSLCFSKSRAARQSPFCKAVARPFQSRRKALPKSTKTGRKSVGFLILTQAPKCTRSHCFPPQKHPKNGFMMRFAGKNSFFQLRARDFSFYMNAYNGTCQHGFFCGDGRSGTCGNGAVWNHCGHCTGICGRHVFIRQPVYFKNGNRQNAFGERIAETEAIGKNKPAGYPRGFSISLFFRHSTFRLFPQLQPPQE